MSRCLLMWIILLISLYLPYNCKFIFPIHTINYIGVLIHLSALTSSSIFIHTYCHIYIYVCFNHSVLASHILYIPKTAGKWWKCDPISEHLTLEWCDRCSLITKRPKAPTHYRYQNLGPLLHPLCGIEWCSVLRLLVFLCILRFRIFEIRVLNASE